MLVVGAAGGVGMAMTRLLAQHDYAIIGTVLNEQRECEVRAQVPTVQALVKIDLRRADDIAPALSPILNQPNLDLTGVVITPHGPLETASLSSLRQTMEVNTFASIAIFQACMPQLRRSKGRLVLIAPKRAASAFPFSAITSRRNSRSKDFAT